MPSDAAPPEGNAHPGELSQEEEASLYGHYGLDYSEARSDSGLPEGNGGQTADRGPGWP
jgi:hypothetical protein